MGSFMGHAAPGTFFLIFGAWWAFATVRRYLICRRDGIVFVSTPIFSWTASLKKSASCSPSSPGTKGCCAFLAGLPMEAMVKVLFSIMGMCIEIGAHLPPPIPSRIVQHTTMYAFFLLSGGIDIICHLGVSLPDGIQYGSMALALTVEGLLFASHVHGREILDIHIHMLLVKVIVSSIVVLLLEARYRRHPLLPLGRAFLLMLQGSWFWAVAIILYKHGEGNSDWDLNSPGSLLMATVYFSWHCATIFISMVVMNMVMAYHYRRLGTSDRTQALPDAISLDLPKEHASYNILSTDEDDDDDDDDDDCNGESRDKKKLRNKNVI